MAVAHSMLIAIYHILKSGERFKDLGEDYYNQFNREKKKNYYLKEIDKAGSEFERSHTFDSDSHIVLINVSMRIMKGLFAPFFTLERFS